MKRQRDIKENIKPAKNRPSASGGAPNATPVVFGLGYQSDYRCHNTGVCCKNWRIPVEQRALRTISEGLEAGRIAMPSGRSADPEQCFETREGLPAGAVAQLKFVENACVFLESAGAQSSCAIHRQVGSDSLPLACQLFPRICVIRPDGVWLTTSHYCPTAAGMLFREDMDDTVALAIVRDPPAFPPGNRYGGLDARRHAPPLLRPNVPMSWNTYDLWERHAVKLLARPDYSPEEALIVLTTTAEKLRGAEAVQAGRPDFLAKLLAHDFSADPTEIRSQISGLPSGLEPGRRLYQFFLELIRQDEALLRTYRGAFGGAYFNRVDDLAPERFAAEYERLVRPVWNQFMVPLRRYLIAKVFANYFAYQGDGLRSGLFAVVYALSALRVHATQACARENRLLDRQLLTEAFRMTDYLHLHIWPAATLARLLSRVENFSLMELIGPIRA